MSDTEWEDSTYGDADEDVGQAQRELEADQLEEEAVAAGDALEEEAAAQPKLYFASLPDFVDQFLTKAYRRHIPANAAWCTEWWKHGEAVCVLSALWRAWEALRLEPGTGMSVWWRDHCYPHMGRLMDPAGTFKNCTRANHYENGPLEPLPWGTPPPELYDPLTYGA
jgi:hypothetical protein